MPDANSAKPTTEPLPPPMTPRSEPEADEASSPTRQQAVRLIERLSVCARRIETRLRAGDRRWWLWAAGAVLLLLVLVVSVPWVVSALTTVSTDDAYVGGHVTFVAPRVPGQVARVQVDDNNRVRTGDLLVELDKEPYKVDVKIAEAAVVAAQADLVAAQAEVRGLEGLARSQRFALAHASEELHNRVAEIGRAHV